MQRNWIGRSRLPVWAGTATRSAAAHGLPAGSGETWPGVEEAITRLEADDAGERATSFPAARPAGLAPALLGSTGAGRACPGCGVVPVPDVLRERVGGDAAGPPDEGVQVSLGAHEGVFLHGPEGRWLRRLDLRYLGVWSRQPGGGARVAGAPPTTSHTPPTSIGYRG